VGIASYLLINFWHTRIAANNAAAKAFLTNRIGDYFMVIAMLLIINRLEDLSINFINAVGSYSINSIIILLIILAASAKSAQIGLHGW
jgi:NADH:ubiquinone oxidoreductase subunit 5 (subunit L)/multisubunit Na+/H+ antiporter MnhA subunit